MILFIYKINQYTRCCCLAFTTMSKGFFVTSLLLSVLSYLCSASSEEKTVENDTPSPFDSVFDTLVNQNLKHWHVPGFSIAIVDGNATFSRVSCSPHVHGSKLANSLRVMASLHFLLRMSHQILSLLQRLLLKPSLLLPSRS